MIVGFSHEALERLNANGSTRGIHSDHAKKLRRILAALDAASGPARLALPSYRLDRLEGDREGRRSILVNGNWRVIIRFDGDDVTYVDDLDDP